MQLEVISRTAEAADTRAPIVLIHGAWHGAWCWEGNFFAYFAERGWEVHALSLRGHGNSAGRDRLRWWSIADYVADVAQVVSSLDRSPILIGHSMGGFVAQKYLESHPTAGAVLLASVPPSGTVRFNLRAIRRHPLTWLEANVRMTTFPIVRNRRHVREWFFSPDISDEALARHHARLQDESFRAALDMLCLNLPKPARVRTPIAVVGAASDQMFAVAEVEQTARAYGVDAKIFPGLAHNMIAEPGWESVAQWIAEWALARSAPGTAPPFSSGN